MKIIFILTRDPGRGMIKWLPEEIIMNIKSQYKTRHRSDLIAYLETVPGQHVTVSDICASFKEKGQVIGTATVYRQMERLVSEGLVNKYIIDANSPACFEYIGGSRHCCEPVCFHCKCEKCGVLIHMHCDELEGLAGHLREHHNFRLDPKRTVFYGLCASCAAQEAEDRPALPSER